MAPLEKPVSHSIQTTRPATREDRQRQPCAARHSSSRGRKKKRSSDPTIVRAVSPRPRRWRGRQPPPATARALKLERTHAKKKKKKKGPGAQGTRFDRQCWCGECGPRARGPPEKPDRRATVSSSSRTHHVLRRTRVVPLASCSSDTAELCSSLPTASIARPL